MRCFSLILIVVVLGSAEPLKAQPSPVPSLVPTVEYQYQLHYPRLWRGFAGPGVSVGGSLPEQGRDGVSSLYGLPFPEPLGSGVYVNPPPFTGPAAGFRGLPPAFQPVWPGPGPMLFPGPIPPGSGFPGGGFPGSGPWGAVNSRNAPPLRPTRGRSVAPPRPMSASSIRPAAQIIGSPALEAAAENQSDQDHVASSSPAARQLSREQQDAGDVQMRTGHWSQACLNYRHAVDAAEDRAEAHLRLGFAHTALLRFPAAVREFKQALSLDPAAASSAERLTTLFGSDSAATRKSIQRQISGWVREDLHNADRLFLLGFWLHCDDDSRASEILEAALRFTDQDQHIVALLVPTRGATPPATPPHSTVLTQSPALNELPLPPPPSPDDNSSRVPDRNRNNNREGHPLPPLPAE